jgi:hypothetical protein
LGKKSSLLMGAPTCRVELLRRFSPSGRDGVQGWRGDAQGEKKKKKSMREKAAWKAS